MSALIDFNTLPTNFHPHPSGFKPCRLRYSTDKRCTCIDWKYIAYSVSGNPGSRTGHVTTAYINLVYCKLASVSPFLPPKLK